MTFLKASFLLCRTDFNIFIKQQRCLYKTLQHQLSNKSETYFNPLKSLLSTSVIKLELPKHKVGENEEGFPLKGKNFRDLEAEFHHSILTKLDEYSETIYKVEPEFFEKYPLTQQEFDNIIKNDDWNNKSTQEIATAFISLGVFSSLNLGLSINDQMFSNIVKAFTNKCSEFSDEQLINCTIALRVWPPSNNVKEENFLNVWKCLDQVFYERMHEWSIDKMLYMMDLWYHIKLSRLSWYTYRGLAKISNKCSDLTKSQMVQTLFYFSCIRKIHPSISMRDYEYYLQKHITYLTIEEIGIVALAFFKIKKTILNVKILNYIMNRTVDEAEEVNNVTLTAISKCLRFSHKPHIGFMANDFCKIMMEKKKDTLNFTSAVHIAHISTQVQFFNKEVITDLAEKFCSNPSEARLKDIERLMLILSLFNYIPPSTPDILSTVVNEIERMEHILAGKQHYLTLLSLMYYLSLLRVYPDKRIQYVLNEDIIRSNYQSKYMYPMQLVQLDYNRVLEGPAGSEFFLSPEMREYLARRHSRFAPDDQYPTNTKFQTMFKEVIDCTNKLIGKDCNYVTHILPHFPIADILFRLDENGEPVPIPREVKVQPEFENVLRAPDPTGWYAVVLGGRNMYLHNEPRMVGEQVTKIRQLKLLGYNTIVIPSHYWKSEEDKMAYLKLKYFTRPT